MSDDMSGFNRFSKLDSDDYYTTDEGYVVFTAKYLLKRGYCCKNGCRHCPYGFEKGKSEASKKFRE